MEKKGRGKNMEKKGIKEKILNMFGSLSGITSILGSWQICHNVCLALITLLSIIGITVTGMPLLFLTKIAVQVWFVAVTLLIISAGIYHKKRCISPQILMFNSGLLIAGVPFEAVQSMIQYFWIVGAIISFTAIVLFIKEKLGKRTNIHLKKKGSEKGFIIAFGIILVIGLIGILLFFGMAEDLTGKGRLITQENTPIKTEISDKISDVALWEMKATGSTEQGDVLIELTPKEKKDNKLIVEVKANTHSVDLSSFNLEEIATLTYDGKSYKPLSAPALSGHHASGELVFEVPALDKRFTITINGIPSVNERTFVWG